MGLAASEPVRPSGIAVAADDWPCWRGPTLDGKAAGPAPPVRWSQTENVIWKADVPGRGHCSPCIWGEKVFLTTAIGEEGEVRHERDMQIFHPKPDAGVQAVLCYDRASGQLRWKAEIHRGGLIKNHQKNSHATSTPACDGRRVYVLFPNDEAVWATALDLDGKQLWQTKIGALKGRYGYAASPLLCGAQLIVAVNHPEEGYLKALDTATGEVVWQRTHAVGYSFSSPVVAQVAGRRQLLYSGARRIVSLDPGTGAPLWHAEAPADTLVSTPAWLGDLVFVTGGNPQMGVFCIRGDGQGDVSKSHRVWEAKIKDYVPSPLVVDDRLLVIKDVGVAVCFNARSGEKLWEERLGGGGISASPTLAGGLVYLPNEAGRMFVFKAGTQFELVAENDLGDGGFASPVVCGGQLYLRTLSRLYCIGSPAGGKGN